MAVHQLQLRDEPIQVDVCVPYEEELHIIDNSHIQEELLNEYPKGMLHAAMLAEMHMMKDFDVAT